ncbi:hypothetical protein DFR30_1850 [Thiogranum longum]|uniref:Uncharacterized protein n=1 Tax=Thiogranum longum TaxID=1537524 RepID=A0A4R1HD32_9GAMM|nr:hypothetical protein DFR30_1850 [Thiogranum longum]
MILSEGRKRCVSSVLGKDSAFCLRLPKCSSGQSAFYDQRKLILQRVAVEQRTTADTCFARAAELHRYVARTLSDGCTN